MKKQKIQEPTEIEEHLLKTNLKVMAFEEIIFELLTKNGYSELEAHNKIEETIRRLTQEYYELAEDVDPEGAAHIDKRNLEDL